MSIISAGKRRKPGEGEKRKIKIKLFSSIHGVPSIEICWVKNESSFTRRGLHVGTKTRDFTKDSSEKFGKLNVSILGSVHETS